LKVKRLLVGKCYIGKVFISTFETNQFFYAEKIFSLS